MADESAGWWERSHKPTVFAGIVLLLSTSAIALVVVLSGKIDFSWLAQNPKESRPAEIQLQPYAATANRPPPTSEWPSSPAYRRWNSGKPIAPIGTPARNAQAGSADEAPEIQEPPLPRGDFIAAAEAGQKVYVPNPKGQCKLMGVSGSALIQALDDCFTSPTK